MFVDALNDLSEDVLKGDVCVIGAGAAGISIAREFVDSGQKIILLESGGLEIDAETQALYEGPVTGRDYIPLDATRLRYFGGSTNHWGGMVAPLMPVSLEERSWVPFSGWPIGGQELAPYYERAAQVIELHDTAFDMPWIEDALVAERLPLDPAFFVTHMMRYSPPTRFGSKYHDLLRDAENIVVVLNANVLELRTNEAVDHLEFVACGALDGRRFEVSASSFVLATGGIENPRLLLLSNRQQPMGLGNEHDLVGRYFMEHPQYDLGKIVPTEVDLGWSLYDGERWRRKDPVRAACKLTPSPALQERDRLLNSTTELMLHNGDWGDSLTDESHRAINGLGQYLRNHGIIGNRKYRSMFAYDKPVEFCDLLLASEQAPNPRSRVFLTHEKDAFDQNRVALDWRLTDLDVRSLEMTTELLAQQIGKAGIGRMQIDIKVDAMPGGNHHMGTTRMDNDPRLGVVDTDCRLHAVDNFYIAGSSVFPTSGCVNPTFTIVALAIRLSDHLKERMG